MYLPVTLRILGLLVMLFSLTNLPAMFVAHVYGETEISLFLFAFMLTLAVGFLLWLPVRKCKRALSIYDGYLVSVLFWLVLGLAGALPLYLLPKPAISLTDAIFESISGLTTTGATVLSGIDFLPKCILFYRQQLQWLGGMGIVVLAVAVLPILGIGGMQLYRTEIPGPSKDTKLTPRIAQTAKYLWFIYVGLTLTCALAYWFAGMSFFDAICHSFSTVSIGGFSTHDHSLGYFHSSAISWVAVFFMLACGVNFSLHFSALRSANLQVYWKDVEFRAYLLILLLLSVITVLVLYATHTFSWGHALRYGVAEVVSIATTSGFSFSDFSLWPTFLPFMLFLSSFIGGCAGSTAGGMKVVRIVLILKQASREMKQLLHPNGVFLIKLGNRPVGSKVSNAIWGFFSAYVILFIILFLLLLATGLNLPTSFSAVASCMNNLGPALSETAYNYSRIGSIAKYLLCVAMLLGRLEIFTLLILFTPYFWRK